MLKKCTCNKTLNTDKPMTTIPDLGQAHETYGGIKLVPGVIRFYIEGCFSIFDNKNFINI